MAGIGHDWICGDFILDCTALTAALECFCQRSLLDQQPCVPVAPSQNEWIASADTFFIASGASSVECTAQAAWFKVAASERPSARLWNHLSGCRGAAPSTLGAPRDRRPLPRWPSCAATAPPLRCFVADLGQPRPAPNRGTRRSWAARRRLRSRRRNKRSRSAGSA